MRNRRFEGGNKGRVEENERAEDGEERERERKGIRLSATRLLILHNQRY